MPDATGQSTETSEYLPFGLDRYATENTATDHKFTDQEQDRSTGLYNYNARLYDPAVGLFVTPDSIVPNWYAPQSLNRYAYALNNPLYYIDPSGHYNCTGLGYCSVLGEVMIEVTYEDGTTKVMDVGTFEHFYQDKLSGGDTHTFISGFTKGSEKDNRPLQDFVVVFTSVGGGAGDGSVEAGVAFVVDYRNKEVTVIGYAGAGLGLSPLLGLSGAGTIQIGVYRLRDAKDLTGIGYEFNATFAAGKNGRSVQFSGNFDGAWGSAGGYASGAAAGGAFMLTYGWDLGTIKLDELPSEVIDKLDDFRGKE